MADCRNITIPITAAVIACVVSAAVDIGIVIFQQSSLSDMLLTPTVFPFHALIPTLFLPLFCFSSLHPFSFLNVFGIKFDIAIISVT